MNIKSLLLGSAAALLAFSSARAADVVVAEPEPVEYVRVCDAYGTGYFYIPGTETCLKIGGYVRYDIGVGDLFGAVSDTGDDTYFKRARASVQLSTASETELGTLRTFVETRWQWDTNGDAPILNNPGYTNTGEFEINFAYIELGGFRVGKDESFFTTFPGYAGNVINDDFIGGYGPYDTNLISYTFTSGAFTAGLSLEEGVTSNGIGSGWGIDDYVPHVVAGLGYDFGIVNLRGVVGFDTRDDVIGELRGGFAAKLRADVDITETASVFVMGLYGENSSGYTTWAKGPADDETLSIIAGGSVQFTEKATFNLQGQWIDGNTQDDAWNIVANVAYELVPGLTITPEVAYADFGEDLDGDGDDDDGFGGYLRFERSF